MDIDSPVVQNFHETKIDRRGFNGEDRPDVVTTVDWRDSNVAKSPTNPRSGEPNTPPAVQIACSKERISAPVLITSSEAKGGCHPNRGDGIPKESHRCGSMRDQEERSASSSY